MTEPPDPFAPDRDEHEPQLARLADAIDAYLERSGDSLLSDSALLDRHADLSEFLGPMLDNRNEVDPSQPTSIGGYVIEREVGRGGMGIVYEAVHETLGRRVALKVLPVLLSVSPRRIERFLREARAVARLEHPNLVRIHEVGETNGTWFFAMELVPGQNLRDAFAAVRDRVGRDPRRFDGHAALGIAGCTSWHDEVAELGASLADALACAHRAGLVHRDVKPHNVLVGEDGRARLVDFGLAKDLEDESLTHSEDFAGTPHYAAPEQIDPQGPNLDGRADVFALGTMLYELLGWRRPFDGATTEEILHAILTEEPKPLRALAPAVPADLETIVLRALEKDREGRYPSADALAGDLRRFRQGAAIHARPVPARRRLLRLARRHKGASAALVLAFGLFVVAPSIGLLVLDAKNRELVTERDRANRLADHARATVDRLFLRVAEQELPDAPLQQEFRRALLADAVGFYGRLRDDFPADPDLERLEVRARTNLVTAAIELERHGEAVEQLDALIEGLDSSDAPLEEQLRLAGALADRGISHIVLGSPEAGERDLARAERLCARVAATGDPRSRVAYRAHALAARITMLRVRNHAVPEGADADALLADALAALDGLPESERSAPEPLLDRVSILLTQGGRARATGRLDRAEQLLSLAEATLPTISGRRTRLRTLRAALHRERSSLRTAQGRYPEASRELESAMQLQRALHTDFPSDDGMLFDLASAAEATARAELTAQRLEQARRYAHEALRHAETLRDRLSARDSRSTLDIDPLWARVLGTWALMEGQLAAPDLDAVLAAHDESESLFRAMLVDTPRAETWRAFGAALHNHALLRYRARAGSDQELEALLDEAIAAQREALRLDPQVRIARDFLQNHLELRAECAFRARAWESAAHHLIEAVPIQAGPNRDIGLAARMCRCLTAGLPPDGQLGSHCREAALDLLERALDADATLRGQLANPTFGPLHGEPRWQVLARDD